MAQAPGKLRIEPTGWLFAVVLTTGLSLVGSPAASDPRGGDAATPNSCAQAYHLRLKALAPVHIARMSAALERARAPEAGWPGPLEEGLRRELGRSAVEIVGVYSDDTGLRQQLRQAEAALEAHPHVDYVIGSAPAIEATIGYLAARPDRDKPGLIATYVNHTIKRSLMNGNVIAAPFDDPARQGKMALRQAMSVISGHAAARSTGPDIVFLTDADSDLERIPVSPPEYFPDIR